MKSRKNKKINIPLSKILIILFIFFVIRHFVVSAGNEKNVETSEESAQVSNEQQSVKKEGGIFTPRSSRITQAELIRLLEQFPPNLTQDRDTVRWQRSEIIRYFSIDTTLQKRTQRLIDRSRARYGASVAINPQTGQILAMVTRTDPELPQIAPNLALSSKFLAASIAKTVTAQAAFENMDVNTLSSFRFTGRGTTLFRNQFLPLEFGERANSVTFAEAYARSVNPVFGWMAVHHIGRANLLNAAERFGWNTSIPFEMPVDVSFFPRTAPDNLSPVEDSINVAMLGSGFYRQTTLSPILGALIMASILNNGVMMAPTLVDSIVEKSSQRRIFTANSRKWRQTTESDIADSLLLLKQQTPRFTARSAFRQARRTFFSGASGESVVSGGKTGTLTSDLGRNEWFVGFAKDTLRNISLATSVVLVQPNVWHLRPSQVSSDIMYEYVRRKQRIINRETQSEAEAKAQAQAEASAGKLTGEDSGEIYEPAEEMYDDI